MDFKQIEAFIAVAKYKSFSKAADAIFLSQPTVSSHIANLEKELSITLFDRKGREVDLTPAGSVFLEYAINLTTTRETAISKLSSFFSSIKGKLTLAVSTTPCLISLPTYLKNYISLYPDVVCDIKEGSSKKVYEMLISGHCSIGMTGQIIADDRLCYIKIADDKLVAVSGIKSLPTNITIDTFLKQDFILREKGSATRNVFVDFLESIGFHREKLNIIAEISSLEALLQFLKQGIGASIVSEAACSDYINHGLIKKHHIEGFSLKRSIYMVTLKNRTLAPAAQAFYDLVTSSL